MQHIYVYWFCIMQLHWVIRCNSSCWSIKDFLYIILSYLQMVTVFFFPILNLDFFVSIYCPISLTRNSNILCWTEVARLTILFLLSILEQRFSAFHIEHNVSSGFVIHCFIWGYFLYTNFVESFLSQMDFKFYQCFFYTYIKMITWFLFFNLLRRCITLTNL